MTDVLIAGAGPTGLVLALWLHRQAVRVRIIDKANGPGAASRALAVHARTLEFYAMLGIAEEMIEAGRKVAAVNLWALGRHRARVPIGDIGEGLSPYPFVLILPQDVHERLLLAHLQGLGVPVEYRTELLSFEQRGSVVTADIDGPSGQQTVEARFLCGCDGAHSYVRHQLGVDFAGGNYNDLFYVADVTASGPPVNGELHVFMSRSRFHIVFPLKPDGTARLVGLVPRAYATSPTCGWKTARQVSARKRGSRSARSTGSRPITSATAWPSVSAPAGYSCSAMPATSIVLPVDRA